MAKGNPEYWKIMEASFPEASHSHYLELKSDLERAEKLEQSKGAIQNERLNRIMQASEDPVIFYYFSNQPGSEETLKAHIQRQYDLSETEARSAIDCGIGKLHEVAGYGDEA
jgi:hypothetical protein